MAHVLKELKQFDRAVDAITRGLALDPENVSAYNTLSGLLRICDKPEEALAAAQTALQLDPQCAEAALNISEALFHMHMPEKALEACQKAIVLKPDYGSAYFTQGSLFRALDRFDEAEASYHLANAHGRFATFALALLTLLRGDWERGFDLYEARKFQGHSLREGLSQVSGLPWWGGPGSPARRVLVLLDQSNGDLIHFSRYLLLMQRQGVEVHLMCFSRMRRLISPLVQGRVHAMKKIYEPHVVEGKTFHFYFKTYVEGIEFDAIAALTSLPHIFKTRLDTVPAEVPYLHAEPALIEKWAAEIGTQGFRIGCAWCGNPVPPHKKDHRSYPLKALAPLAAIPHVRLISLQFGLGVEQLDDNPGFPIMRMPAGFDAGSDGFIDTAALMMSLDLIITSDTSTAHLAGALGRPVWVALKKDCEWRWMRDRSDSPWYPTMRLFRQKTHGVWGDVFAEMKEALIEKIASP